MKLNTNVKEEASRSAKKSFFDPIWPRETGVGGMVTQRVATRGEASFQKILAKYLWKTTFREDSCNEGP